MPLQHLIHELNKKGQSATIELPNGKWCHSPEYIAARYRTREVKTVAKPVAQPASEHILEKLLGKLTPAERALVLAQLSEE